MSNPLLHVGYHKTGTTWLQRSVFPEPTTGFSLIGGVEELQPVLVRPGPYHFDVDRVREKTVTQMESARERGLVPALSLERLSGNPHHGGRDAGVIAWRLREAFPDARVLIVIREQQSMVLSLYKTYVRLGGTATLQQYLRDWPSRQIPPLFDFAHLEYHNLIGRYRDLFGAENVMTLPYELLKEHPWQFVKRAAQFAGAEVQKLPRVYPVNVSYSAFGLSVKRLVNKWCVESPLNPAPVLPVRIPEKNLRKLTFRIDARMPRAWRESWDGRWTELVGKTVGERYAESNAATAQLTGLNLGRFGYQI